MFVCVVHLRLFLFSVQTLKEKRGIVKSLLEKARQKFGIAIAEIGDHDLWQSSRIGIAMVGNDKGQLEKQLGKILAFIEQGSDLEVVSAHHEIWGFKDE